MIDIDVIRHQPDVVKEHMRRRGADPNVVDELWRVDQKWRALNSACDALRFQQNRANEQIANAGSKERGALIASMKTVSNQLKEKNEELAAMGAEREIRWRGLPNMLWVDVPDGDAANNQVLRRVPDDIPKKNFPEKSYFELAEPRLVDFERAGKVSGSRFVYIKGELARLQMGLISFVFDRLAPAGFTPIIPPVLVNEPAMRGMGYLDHAGDEIYQTQDGSYLVGTSEQSLGPMHMNEILSGDTLPLRYVGFSACFRREAGSHGKDVRGMLRLHQFDKIEMFSFTRPESSESQKEHEFLLEQQEGIMQALELPYRVVLLAAQDLGSPAAKTYDIETWLPSEQQYRETHSTSNTSDYQARRLSIRCKEGGERRYVHMLNGTALAMSRIFIALLENHQHADGSVAIPPALHPYVPFNAIAGA